MISSNNLISKYPYFMLEKSKRKKKRMNFCHAIQKKVLSHIVVTSVYKTPKISIGYDFKVYIPKDIAENFKSKYDLALELIKDAYRRGLIKKIYFDSWRGVSQDCQAILWIRRLSGY